MLNLRRIGVNMVSGGAGYIVPMVIHIFSTPYVIRSLGEEAYGLQSLASVVIGYLVVADMGLDIPITRKVAEYYALKESDSKRKFLSATIKLYFIIGLAGMAIVLASTEKLVAWFAIPLNLMDEARNVFYLTSIGFLGSILTMWGKAVFNGIHRYDISNSISVFNNLFGITLGIVLLMNGYGVVGFFAARILGFTLASMLYVILAKRYLNGFKFLPIIDIHVWQYLKTQIGYGVVLRLSGLVFSKMDQALISAWIGIAVVGIYSVPLLIATTLSGLISSITHFAFPMASAMNVSSSAKEVEVTFIRVTKLIVVLSTLIFIPFIVLGSNFFALWISPAMSVESQEVFMLLLVAFYLNTCFTAALNSFVVGMGHLRFFTLYSIGRSLTLLLGFIFLIKIFGMEGAGMAFVVSIAADAIYFMTSVRKKLNFQLKHLLLSAYTRPIAVGVGLMAVLLYIKPFINTWFELMTVSLVFVAMYILISIAAGVLEKSERSVLFVALTKLKTRIFNGE